MSDVFISYSRRDKDFVKRLQAALAAGKRDVWVDWEDIPPTADWWREIQSGIEAANAFVFVITPDSVRSEVCNRELDYALKNNKRLIPILNRDVTDPNDEKAMNPAIGSHNWLFFRDTDDFDSAFAALINAVDTDLGQVRIHTRLLTRAKEWDTNNRNASFLLQGDDLTNAEAWLARGINKKPAPTDLHTAYILASRRAASNRQRRLLAGVSVALVISVVLALLSFSLYGEANRQQAIAVNNAATATIAQGQAEVNAATATFAQGQAEINAATAVAGATAVADANQQAQSVALAGQAEVELEGPRPERGVLLALAAFQNHRYTWQAERALAFSLQPTLEHFELISSNEKMTSLDWSPDGSFIVTGTNQGNVFIWKPDGQPNSRLEQPAPVTPAAITRVRWSPDGSHIATADAKGGVQIWSVSNGDALLQFTLGDSAANGAAHGGSVNDIAWSSDSLHLASASADKTAKIWDAATGGLLATLSGHTAAVNSVQWSPDGSRLVTVSNDRAAKMWDATTGKEIVTLSGLILSATWSPNGKRLATASTTNTITIWSVNDTGIEAANVLLGHTGRINRVAWSSDGVRLATASDDDSARVWNPTSGQLLRTLFGHTGNITDLAWEGTPGNPRLITVSEDQTARMWNSDTGGELLKFSGASDTITGIFWPKDGQYVAALVNDGTVRVWQVWRSDQTLTDLARGCCAQRILTDEENIQFGLPTATVAPTLSYPPTALAGCEAALPTRLYPGARGMVSDDDPALLNVRVQPGTNSRRIAQVSPGQTFQVTGGPECAEGLNWFHIIYGIGAVQGWIAEGQDGQYFVQLVG
jgi:WD40 repeat protein